MIAYEKPRALIGIPLGLLLVGAPLITYWLRPKLLPAWFYLIVLGAGLLLYVWGCAALARGKGYNSILVLTVVLGVIFPLVVLLTLPDRNRVRARKRIRRRKDSPAVPGEQKASPPSA